jgi:hypothetical protein
MRGVRPSSLALAFLGVSTCTAALLAGFSGCVLPSFTLAPDGGHEDSGPPPPPPCGFTYPDPPGGMDDPSSDLPPIVIAMKTIDLGDLTGTPGYDLDHVCTCIEDAGPSCVGASLVATQYCDADGGVDNSAAKLFQLLQTGGVAVDSLTFSNQIKSGGWTLLVRISGYNGKADDPKVDVDVFPSPGLGGMPTWDGNDAWPISATSVGDDAGVSVPKYHANGAYVTKNTLVATMPTAEILFRGGTKLDLKFSAGVITGTLESAGGIWSIKNGTLAARWPIAEVLRSIGSYRDNNDMPFCIDKNALAWAIAKPAICRAADILIDGTQPKSSPCDAISMGIGFSTGPAALGPIVDGGGVSDGCAPSGDPANATCP